MSLVIEDRTCFSGFCPCLYYNAVLRHVKQDWLCQPCLACILLITFPIFLRRKIGKVISRMDLSPILTVSRPFLGDIYHGQIQHFLETVIGWKYRLGFGDFPELAVKSFNRVRGIDQTSDSFRILKIR